MLHPHRGLGASFIHNSRNTRIDLRNFVLRRHAKCLEDHIGRLVANRYLSVFLGGFEPQRQSPPQTYHEWRNLQCQTPFQVRSPWTFSPPCPPPTNIYPRKIKVANAIASI